MALTVTAASFGYPLPGLYVTLSGLTVAQGNVVTLRRAWSGQVAPVRGAVGVPVTGDTMTFRDYEAPFAASNYVSQYLAAESAADGSTVDQGSGYGTLGGISSPWISDPLAPSVAAAVRLDGAALSSLTYARAGDVLQPVGSALPVAVVGTRMAAGGVPLDVLCSTLAQRDATLGVLLGADPVCVRVPADDPRYSMLPPLAYVTTDTVTQQPLDVQMGGTWTRILWTGQMVRPPASTVLAPSYTYASLLNDASAYSYLPTLWTTYNDMING